MQDTWDSHEPTNGLDLERACRSCMGEAITTLRGALDSNGRFGRSDVIEGCCDVIDCGIAYTHAVPSGLAHVCSDGYTCSKDRPTIEAW